MWKVWANYLLPKALKTCPKFYKSPNLVTMITLEMHSRWDLPNCGAVDGARVTAPILGLSSLTDSSFRDFFVLSQFSSLILTTDKRLLLIKSRKTIPL